MLTGKKAVIFDMDGSLIDSMWIWPEVDRIYMDKYHDRRNTKIQPANQRDNRTHPRKADQQRERLRQRIYHDCGG